MSFTTVFLLVCCSCGRLDRLHRVFLYADIRNGDNDDQDCADDHQNGLRVHVDQPQAVFEQPDGEDGDDGSRLQYKAAANASRFSRDVELDRRDQR